MIKKSLVKTIWPDNLKLAKKKTPKNQKKKKNQKTLDFIQLTTIDKLVLQLILISFVCMDVRARGPLMWEEAGLPEENPRVQKGDHHTLSHTIAVGPVDQSGSQR